MSVEANFNKPKYEWCAFRSKNYVVTVVAWGGSNILNQQPEWCWNVYVVFNDTHPYYENPEKAVDEIPFHGGCTYDEKIEYTPAQGIQYDWQKAIKSLKVGCDYAHLGDDWVKQFDPRDGVPSVIQNDVNEIIEFLGEQNA